VRELANALERALVVGTPPTVRVEDLPLTMNSKTNGVTGDSLADMEREHIAKVLEREDWNITHAAEKLRIDRVTLYNKIKKYGLRK
jgi:transcriptional regulator of acetoin/glycerol metabolism